MAKNKNQRLVRGMNNGGQRKSGEKNRLHDGSKTKYIRYCPICGSSRLMEDERMEDGTKLMYCLSCHTQTAIRMSSPEYTSRRKEEVANEVQS